MITFSSSTDVRRNGTENREMTQCRYWATFDAGTHQNREANESYRWNDYLNFGKASGSIPGLSPTLSVIIYRSSRSLHSYQVPFSTIEHNCKDEVLCSRFPTNAGIKLFGHRTEAMLKEFAQFEDKSVFQATKAEDLSSDQKRKALALFNLIKEKRFGEIKGRSYLGKIKLYHNSIFTQYSIN